MSNDDIQRTLGQIEGKLDQILDNHKDIKDKQESHDHRLRKLENWKAGMVASVAIISAAFSYLWDWFKR